MSKQNPFAEINLLRALANSPDAQWDHALKIIAESKNALALVAAAKVLGKAARPAAREVLIERYRQLDADGTRRDQGALVRTAFVEALRPMGIPADLPLLERAASTFEVLPTSPEDVAGGLRAAALVSLAQLDEELARWHAVRLLHSDRIAAMSGEPAVTAARVLATLGELLAVYGYVSAPNAHGDVLGEGLRHLAALPPLLLADLSMRLLPDERELVLVGLFDLLLAHPCGTDQRPGVRRWLDGTTLLDAYRYLATVIVAGRDRAWLDLLLEHARATRDAVKQQILREALELKASEPAVKEALARLASDPSR